MIRLGSIASLVTTATDLGEMPFVALESVDAGTGRLSSGELPTVSLPESGAASAAVGDVLFGKLRPYLAKTWRVDRPVYASTELMCIRPSDDIESRWLAYVAMSRPVIEWAVASSDGAKMPRTSWDRFRQYRLLVPPPDEQRAIAAYLDRETARIDALMVAKRDQASRLEERTDALVQEAIDRSRPDSLPLRRLVAVFVDYRGATPEKSSSGVPLITATNVNNGRINLALGEQFVTDETYTLWMRRGFPAVGDVLITTEAPLGEVAAITDARVALAQRIILLKPNPDRVVPGFLRVSLLSSRVQADLLSRASGSTVWGIRADRLRDVMVPLPGPAEQQRVVEIARDAEQASLVTRRLINRQVQLLTERRQALITAAVTGRLDVPVAA